MTRDELLSAFTRKPVPFSHGQFSGYLRFVTAAEWSEWEKVKATNPDANFAYWLAVRGICDESGNRVLDDADAAALDTWPLGVVNAIAERVQRMTGMEASKDSGKA